MSWPESKFTWYHSVGWRRKLKPQGLFFPEQIAVTVHYILIKKKKKGQEILRNFKKCIWGIFFHNYTLIYVLPLKICVEVILLLFATVFWICSKDNTAILHSLWKKTAHSKAAELLSDK